MQKPIVLCICDGFGYGEEKPNNAVYMAKTPNLDRCWAEYPHTLLTSDGRSVGLPDHCTGTSEANHFTMGAGRIVNQIAVQIDVDIESGAFFKNLELKKAFDRVDDTHAVHLMGLLSDGGVHSQWNQIFAMIDFAKQEKIKNVYIHAILDGRDVPEKSADKYLKEIEAYCKKQKTGEIVSIIGRYYAMDRDKNYDRTEIAYNLFFEGEGQKIHDLHFGLKNAYRKDKDLTDYYVEPICKVGDCSDPLGRIKPKDSVIFFNTRSDRARQIMYAMTDPKFDAFKRDLPDIHFCALADYDQNYHIVPKAYKQPVVHNNLNHVLADNKLKQLHIAETEKYAHVTFFFNSQVEDLVPGEDRIMVPSPKVPSYDQKPEMSAYELTEKVLAALDNEYDVIILNFANCDLVGHAGVMEAAVKAVEVVDECVERIIEKVLTLDGVLLWTADHGNAEDMFDLKTKEVNPSHTRNPVPCILIDNHHIDSVLHTENVGMRDIAPTILTLLDVQIPVEMEGHSLIADK